MKLEEIVENLKRDFFRNNVRKPNVLFVGLREKLKLDEIAINERYSEKFKYGEIKHSLFMGLKVIEVVKENFLEVGYFKAASERNEV